MYVFEVGKVGFVNNHCNALGRSSGCNNWLNTDRLKHMLRGPLYMYVLSHGNDVSSR